MRLADVTGVGRGIDPRYPTNLGIAVLTVAVGVGAFAWRLLVGDPVSDAVGTAARGAAALFLGWALAREIDPVGELAAFLGAGLAAAAVLVGDGRMVVVAGVQLLVALRVANRSTGRGARTLDTFVMIALTGWCALAGVPVLGLVAAAAFGIDAVLDRQRRARNAVGAGCCVALAIFGWILTFSVPAVTSRWTMVIAGAAAIGFVLRVRPRAAARIVTDAGDATLDPRRVAAAQALAVAVVAWGIAAEQLGTFAPLAAAVVGSAVGPRR